MIYGSFGGSLFLIALGAILRYAVTAQLDWIDIDTVGVILMVTGATMFLLTLFFGMSRGRPPGQPPPL